MHYETLLVEEEEGILKLTLNRPEKLNALNAKVYEDLGLVMRYLESSTTVRVVVITGAGRAFCSGGDLAELHRASVSTEAAQARFRMSHSIAIALHRLRQPIIMAINGDAVGAGCTLALGADLRIAAETARFGLTFLKVGLSVDMGGGYYLPRVVGLSKACELALLGDLIGAVEAERIGLVNKIVPSAEVIPTAMNWARCLARGPTMATELTKATLHNSSEMNFAMEIENEINIQSVCLCSDEARARITGILNTHTKRAETQPGSI